MGRQATFEKLDRAGRIDLDSGAWEFETNQRQARCGRCGKLLFKGHGRPYNEFMTDGYRARTRYLCRSCSDTVT